MTPEPCTTWSLRLRHLSTNLHPPRYAGNGRVGDTLCGANAYDEENRRAFLAECRTTRAKPFVLADLPECKKCARAAQGGTR